MAKFAEVFTLGLLARDCCIVFIRKRTDVDFLAVDHYLCAPKLASRTKPNPLDARSIVSWFWTIAAILLMIAEPQVRNPVVALVAVDVINVPIWPPTIMKKPSKAMCVLLFALPLALEISATALGCSYFTRLRSQLIDLQS